LQEKHGASNGLTCLALSGLLLLDRDELRPSGLVGQAK